MLDFIAGSQPESSTSKSPETTVPNIQDVPKEMDIFFKGEKDFLPPGKTIKDLTPEELTTLKEQYKYAYMIPGIYQGITGLKGMI